MFKLFLFYFLSYIVLSVMGYPHKNKDHYKTSSSTIPITNSIPTCGPPGQYMMCTTIDSPFFNPAPNPTNAP